MSSFHAWPPSPVSSPSIREGSAVRVGWTRSPFRRSRRGRTTSALSWKLLDPTGGIPLVGEGAGATMFFAATYSRTGAESRSRQCLRTICPQRGNSLGTAHRPDSVLCRRHRGDLGHRGSIETLAPSMVKTDEARRRWGRIERLTASPDVLAESTRAVMESDVTPVLSAIQAPTLVISRQGDRHVRHEHGGHIAGRIRGARLVELSGDDHLPFAVAARKSSTRSRSS